MAFTRFNDAVDFNNKGARSLPDQPTISADALKRKFDEDARDVVAPKVNVIVGELEDPTASASLGAVAPTGFSGSTVQAVLNSIASGVGTAVADAHTHSNKMLLDTYTQTETNLADAVTKKHDHSNKSLLDTYTQTESNLADAVSKKHAHTNKTVLDDLSDSSGNLYYKGNPISGGGGTWGTIAGDIDDQADLKNALDAKADTTDIPTDVSDLNNDLGFQTASDVSTAVATKSNVAWTQITTASGNTKIATITIDSIPTDVYAPTSGGGGGSSTFAGLSDVSLSGSPVADQIVQYKSVVTPDGTAIKLQNVNMPTIPTAVSQLSNDSGFQNASDVSTAISTAIGGLDVTTSGAGAGKTLSALTETDGKISATFQNISITKSQVSDFPAIPDELKELTGDVAIGSTITDGHVLTYSTSSGKWSPQAPASGGHTMTPTPGAGVNEASIVTAINTAITEGGVNDDVVSAYGVGKWSDVKEVVYAVHGTSSSSPIGTTGVGTWDDTFTTQTDWLYISELSGILSDPNKHVEIVIDPDYYTGVVPVFGGWLIDDSTCKICIKFANEISDEDCETGVVGVKITTDRTVVSWINGAPT